MSRAKILVQVFREHIRVLVVKSLEPFEDELELRRIGALLGEHWDEANEGGKSDSQIIYRPSMHVGKQLQLIESSGQRHLGAWRDDRTYDLRLLDYVRRPNNY
jgi:hypothetical protein